MRSIAPIFVSLGVTVSFVAVPGSSAASSAEGDEKVRVIQPREFIRKGRLELAPRLGMSLNDRYIQHYLTGLSATYHISDTIAAGASFDYAFNATTTVTDEILEKLNVRTALSPIRYIVNANFEYIPIYGKVAFANRAIAHWDFALGLGAGVLATKATGLHPSVSLGMGLRTYLTRWMTVAWEIRDHIFSETITVNSASSGGLTHTLLLLVRLSFFLPTDRMADE